MKIAQFINQTLALNGKFHWSKLLIGTLIATTLFYTSIELISSESKLPNIKVPLHWQKIELTLHGNYFAQEGEIVSIVENNGNLILKKAVLLKLQRDQLNNFWTVLIATEPIHYQKLKELNLKKPEELYIAPLISQELKLNAQIKRKLNYELNY